MGARCKTTKADAAEPTSAFRRPFSATEPRPPRTSPRVDYQLIVVGYLSGGFKSAVACASQ